ncbi:MAG: integrase arm-type DNA-binding domain-containing protein [Ruegeria sp.]
MTERLTDTKVASLKAKERRYEVRDSIVRGLYIEVGAKGAKVWWLQTARGKKRERIRLGAFPGLNTQTARSHAMSEKETLRSPPSASQIRTLADLFERYAAAMKEKRRSWRDVESVWRNWAEERVGHVHLEDLTALHALDLRDHVALQTSEARAKKVLIYLRPMLTWATNERLIRANPWTGLATGGDVTARDRVLG